MKGDIENVQTQENLKRISANFELELLRLIKTLNLISQSKELYREQMTFIQALTDRYKLRLSDFTIRLLDMERKSHAASLAQDTDVQFSTPKEPALTPAPVIEIITELRQYFNQISTELENNKNDYLNKLDSVYSVYNLQLGASQTDLDHKLRELQKEISRAPDSNGSGGKEKDITEEISQIDYVKPSLKQHETVKTKSNRIDYIGPDEPIKPVSHKTTAQAAPETKTKTETKTEKKASAPSADAEADKNAKIKNSYVIGAGLLILGIIVGVLFYDMLMRMWGVQEVSITDIKTYPSQVNKAVKKASPPQAAKEQVKAPSVPDAAKEKMKEKIQEDKNIPSQIKPPQEPAKEKPADIVSGQLQAKTEKAAVSEQPKMQTGNSPQPAASSTAVKYAVIGVGANVRSGPGMSNDVVTVVKEGDVFSGSGETNGRWVKIKAPDGKEGWISVNVIREVK